jgi:hypothetical protein
MGSAYTRVGLELDYLVAEGHMRNISRPNPMIDSWLDGKKVTIKPQLGVVLKKRWLVYTLIGIVFGVFDFYYQIFISNTFYAHPLRGLGRSLIEPILMIGIWLVPIIPIILHEARFSCSSWLSALASAFTWSTSVVAYYLTNAFQLAIVGVPSRLEMHISNRNDPYFWMNWRGVFLEDLVANNFEWIIVAVIGGTVIGFLLSFIYLRIKAVRLKKVTLI